MGGRRSAPPPFRRTRGARVWTPRRARGPRTRAATRAAVERPALARLVASVCLLSTIEHVRVRVTPQASAGPPEAPEYPLIVPSFAPVATCLPSVSAPGTKTWRWGDVTIVTPEGSGVHVGGILGPQAQPVMAIFSETDTSERILIDAFSGQLVSAGPDDDPVVEK